MGDFREQLGQAFPDDKHQLLFFRQGSPAPPYNHLSPVETFAKFVAEFLPLCPLRDRLDRDIRVEDTNFKKLINLKHKVLGDAARAVKIVEELANGTFKVDDYHPIAPDRIRTLFWVPDVIRDPDAIYKNNHGVIKADEVFVRVYDKTGSKVKLVFTSAFGPKFNLRYEIVTSYLTEPKTALTCISGKPLYLNPEIERATLESGPS